VARKPALPDPPKATKPPLPTRTVTKFLPPWQTGIAGPVSGEVEEIKGEAYDFRHIHPKVIATRRLFVAEFVKDFQPTAALLRLGLHFEAPAVVANRWLKEPYTQWLLDQYIDGATEGALITRNKVISALNREANNYSLDSSGASRVSALGKLAKILGMEIDRTEVNVAVAGGVMLIPVSNSAEDWEKSASKAQLTLKEEARR
jgi:hypothetical protein